MYRIVTFAISAFACAILTYAIPSIVAAIMNQQSRSLTAIEFPLLMGLVGSIDTGLALLAGWLFVTKTGNRWRRTSQGLIAGTIAGSLYIAAAVLLSFSLDGSANAGARLLLFPYVQARMLSLHTRFGWALVDPPLGWITVLSPLPACILGAYLYSRLAVIRQSATPSSR